MITFHARKSDERPVVVDLCCGRGGDLDKWFFCRPGAYTGIDFAEESLRYAEERCKETSKKFDTEPQFFNIDVTQDRFPIEKDESVDLISCQYALHYLVSTQASMHHLLKEVRNIFSQKHSHFKSGCKSFASRRILLWSDSGSQTDVRDL